jgi:succinyl-diaminopimelate desuccinylase
VRRVSARLDLDLPASELTAAICDIPSVSGDEGALADAVENALAGYGHLDVERDGDTVLARTSGGSSSAARESRGEDSK